MRSGDRGQELVDAAARLFRERGYDATSMQDIADAVGLLKGSVYHYIRTKEDLLWAILRPALIQLVERARSILEDESIPLTERLTLAIESHAESFVENHPHMFVLTQENGATLTEPRRKELDDLRTEYFALWRRAIEAGRESGELRPGVEPSLTVHAIFGMVNWMFRWFRQDGPVSATDVADQFAAIAIEGLGVPARA